MNLPTKMSATKLLAKVKQLQKQYPDAIYLTPKNSSCCKYFSGRVKNGPKTHGCIIGQAIRELYPENVAAIKKLDSTEFAYTGIDDILRMSTEVNKLKAIQFNQDHHKQWGDC